MEWKRKVEILPLDFEGERGYDLVVRDVSATVQDYLDSLNAAVENMPLSRGRARRKACAGCDLCCAERAPLTWIDLINLQKTGGLNTLSLTAILQRVAYIVIEGPVVDIMLRRGKDDRCIFLDRKQRLCSVYAFRPLVCQAFICSPASKRARRLWEVIVNRGEDELVWKWLSALAESGGKMVYDEGYHPRPRLSDWDPTPFSGRKAYRDVLLREVCPADLWRRLAVEFE